MTYNNCFASFFEEKVRIITESVNVGENVFNRSRKIDADSQMFMDPDEVIK